MKKIITLLFAAVAAIGFLFGCAPEKENPSGGGNGGNNNRPTNSDLVNFEGKAEPIACGKNLVKRFIEIPNSNWGRVDAGKKPSSFVTYPDVCAYLGCFWFLEAAIENAEINNDETAKAEAVSLMQALVDKHVDVLDGKTTYVDDKGNTKPLRTDLLWTHDGNRVDFYIFGAISLHIASIYDNDSYKDIDWGWTRDEYLEFGLKYADTQWKFGDIKYFNDRFNNPEYNLTGNLFTMDQKDYDRWKGFADQGYSWQTRLWIDDMFMITALQIQAYLATKDDPSYNQDEADSWWKGKTNDENRYLDRAVREMKLYIEKIQGEDGLYWHTTSAKYFWARGNGWMAVGMPEMLKIIEDNPTYSAEAKMLRTEYEAMMSALYKYQKPTGMWAQLINYTSMWSETSGTAMFTYAFITGVLKGWLDGEKYGSAARQAWTELMVYLQPNYDIREVCEGTGAKNDYSWYMNRKRYDGDTHGQAGMLWCAYALTQIKNEADNKKQ